MAELESEIEFSDETFCSESVQRSNLAVSHTGGWHPRTPSRTLPSVASFCLRRIPALSPAVGRQSHDSCPPLCAGSKLKIYADHPEWSGSSQVDEGAPRRPIRSVGLAPSSHRSPVPARRRTTRYFLHGRRRVRAHFVRTLPEVSARARVYAVIVVLALARSLVL